MKQSLGLSYSRVSACLSVPHLLLHEEVYCDDAFHEMILMLSSRLITVVVVVVVVMMIIIMTSMVINWV